MPLLHLHGLVSGVVEVLAEALELAFPQEAAGVYIYRTKYVHAFNKEPAVHHLRRRAVAMTRQNLVV